MRTALNLLFWGHFLVVLRIDIGIDILPDPLGYFLIALGSYRLQKSYPLAKKAGALATAMIFISLPTVFVDVGKAVAFGWSTYSIALLFLKLILVYFIFAILKSIVKDYDNEALIKRAHSVSTIYISLNLVLLAFLSFSMNVSGDFWNIISITLVVAVLIMEVIFLVLIRAVRRTKPSIAIFDNDD